MKTNITRRQDEKGKVRISGNGIYNDVKFTFTIREANKADYQHEMKVNIISPQTNHILQIEGKRKNDYKNKLMTAILNLQKEGEDESLSLEEQEKIKIELERQEKKLQRINAGLPIEELNATASTYLSFTGDGGEDGNPLRLACLQMTNIQGSKKTRERGLWQDGSYKPRPGVLKNGAADRLLHL